MKSLQNTLKPSDSLDDPSFNFNPVKLSLPADHAVDVNVVIANETNQWSIQYTKKKNKRREKTGFRMQFLRVSDELSKPASMYRYKTHPMISVSVLCRISTPPSRCVGSCVCVWTPPLPLLSLIKNARSSRGSATPTKSRICAHPYDVINTNTPPERLGRVFVSRQRWFCTVKIAHLISTRAEEIRRADQIIDQFVHNRLDSSSLCCHQYHPRAFGLFFFCGMLHHIHL